MDDPSLNPSAGGRCTKKKSLKEILEPFVSELPPFTEVPLGCIPRAPIGSVKESWAHLNFHDDADLPTVFFGDLVGCSASGDNAITTPNDNHNNCSLFRGFSDVNCSSTSSSLLAASITANLFSGSLPAAPGSGSGKGTAADRTLCGSSSSASASSRRTTVPAALPSARALLAKASTPAAAAVHTSLSSGEAE